MIKKTVLFLFLFLMIQTSPLWAHSPSGIELNFDEDQNLLQIDVSHLSRNMREHFIRRLVIYKNDEQYKSLTFSKQTTPKNLIQDIPMTVEEGDTIRVKAVCSKAGRAEESLLISFENSDK